MSAHLTLYVPRVLKAEGDIKHAPRNYLGVDKLGRPHWLTHPDATHWMDKRGLIHLGAPKPLGRTWGKVGPLGIGRVHPVTPVIYPDAAAFLRAHHDWLPQDHADAQTMHEWQTHHWEGRHGTALHHQFHERMAHAHAMAARLKTNAAPSLDPYHDPVARGLIHRWQAKNLDELRAALAGASRFAHAARLKQSDFEHGTTAGYWAVAGAGLNLAQERLAHVAGGVRHAGAHLYHALRDKLDLPKVWGELRELGREHGPAFMAYAIAIEVFEDLVLPAVLTAIGKPWLIPVALATHTEPIMYPLYFGVARWLKRWRAQQQVFA